MLSERVLDEVQCALEDWGIAHFREGRVVFLDNGQPLSMLVPPPSLRQCATVWAGLEHLRVAKPPVALLLSIHTNADDFYRLARHCGHMLEVAPVCGVEAGPVDEAVAPGSLPRPQAYERNPWLHAFQEAQFPWLAEHGIHALPCEPQWDGELAARLEQLDTICEQLKQNELPGYSPEAQQALLHPLYVSTGIFRTWGLLGGFGHWLTQPPVQTLLAGYTGHIPLMLGSGHLTERFILQEYCRLDVAVILADARLTAEGVEVRDEKVLLRHNCLWQQAVLGHGMPVVDLGVEFPKY